MISTRIAELFSIADLIALAISGNTVLDEYTPNRIRERACKIALWNA